MSEILLMVQKSSLHQLRLVGYPIIYRVSYIPGFLIMLRNQVFIMFYNLLVDEVIYSVPGAAGFFLASKAVETLSSVRVVERSWSPAWQLRQPNAGGFASNDQGTIGCTPTNVPLWEIPI